MSENILVTGGAGYIGSHTCKALSRRGLTPVVLDNLVYGHPWAVQWGPLVRGDIADRALLDQIFETYRPAAVLHFAAFAYVGESVTDPGKYWRNNAAGTLTLLEAMRDHSCRRLVFSSTCATYGLPQQVPMSEEHPQWPVNPYGWSKLAVERMIADFGAAHGLEAVILRYFNAAGADPEGHLGEEHDPETHLIPLVLRAAQDPAQPVTVFGGDYDTPDGTCVRDYIHVSDLARAHLAALDHLNRKGAAAFNLGTGRGHSVREVIRMAEQVTGREIRPLSGDRRAGDPPRLVASGDLARRELGFEPEYPGLAEIIGHAWNWMQQGSGPSRG